LKAGVYPASFGKEVTAKAPNFYKWAQEVAKHPSVTSIFDEDAILKHTRARIANNRASL
jgi:glutathione S-transferase